jgi:crotonobetainyl-CoA:carnitine CoA-transferase CaiB-like acyl-CoA transferase
LDPELATAAGRRGAHDAIDEQISKWSADLLCREAVECLVDAGVPASPVKNGHAVRPHPQLTHRRFYQTIEHPMVGDVDYPVLPMKFSALGSDLFLTAAPTLGEHNEDVLMRELGMSADELAELAANQIIGTKPSFM